MAPGISVTPGDEVVDAESFVNEMAAEKLQPSNENSRCIILEIFAGSARLSKACRKLGFEAVAVDQTKDRSEQFPIFQIDVTDSQSLNDLESFIDVEKDAILHAHFAPSCGTASRARGRPIPGEHPKAGPQPLRSEVFPDGLPDLSCRDQERVDKANSSYSATVRLIKKLIGHGISVSIENPKNSFFWKYSDVARLLESFGTQHFSIFHHCMHGGKRDKQTAWWSWNPRDAEQDMFQSLALQCDGNHKHEPWRPYKDAHGRTVFPTSEEAAYPQLLCDRVACILKDEALRCGFVFSEDLHQQILEVPNVASRQLFTTQPKGQKLRPLVSEYGKYVALLASTANDSEVQSFLQKLPKGAKVCHRVLFPGGVTRDDMERKYEEVFQTESWRNGEPCELLQVGIPREPADFIRDAVRKGHPRDIIAQVPQEIRIVVQSMLDGDISGRFKSRAAFLKKWLKRSLELKNEEQSLHQKLPHHLQRILEGKRLLLWREILVDLEYPDVAVIDDICSGFQLTGWAPSTGVFRPDVRRPSLGLQQLISMSKGLNASVVNSLQGAVESEHDQFVWDETMTEVDRGWLAPSSMEGECFVAKRFPVPQKDKVRLVDDFTICGVNGAYGLREKLRVQAVDELCAYLAFMLDQSPSGCLPKLTGRTYDLKSAYKQFGVDKWHAERLKIAVKRPGGGVGIFAALALPFGASGSVSSFLRVAASLTYIGVVALQVLWTSFFDDYTCVCVEGEETNVSFYVESLFRLLGVWFAETGSKATSFGPSFKSLGVIFDVGAIPDGTFTLQHTESRKSELVQFLDNLIRAQRATPKELERLHGRLIWFSAFVFGRTMNQLVKNISLESLQKKKVISFTSEFLQTLTDLKHAIGSSKPVVISKTLCTTWYVFTDGAYEPDSDVLASVGAVLISPTGTPVQCFGEVVPKTFVDELLQHSSHPIYELEVLPVVMATRLWMKYLTGCPTVYFLDNVAARATYIKGVGATPPSIPLLKDFVRLEARLRIYSWFGRVPSHSNVADSPSRLVFDDPVLSGCPRVRIVLPTHIHEIGDGSG